MAVQTKLWYLENFNLFTNLKKESMIHLEKITSMHEFVKSQPVHFARETSSSVFFLKRGRVKLTRTFPVGKEMIIALINPGEVFGELSIVDDSERTDFAYAMEEYLICAISRDDFKHFIENNPGLNLKITRLIGLRLKKIQRTY